MYFIGNQRLFLTVLTATCRLSSTPGAISLTEQNVISSRFCVSFITTISDSVLVQIPSRFGAIGYAAWVTTR